MVARVKQRIQCQDIVHHFPWQSFMNLNRSNVVQRYQWKTRHVLTQPGGLRDLVPSKVLVLLVCLSVLRLKIVGYKIGNRHDLECITSFCVKTITAWIVKALAFVKDSSHQKIFKYYSKEMSSFASLYSKYWCCMQLWDWLSSLISAPPYTKVLSGN